MRLRSRKIAVILCSVLVATWVYLSYIQQQQLRQLCGFLGGPSVTTPRVKLRDGRYLAYKELGVPRENATHKMIYLHGFGNSRHIVVIADRLPQTLFEELGLYIVSYDRPGYGESDPDPKRTLKSMSRDIEELADQLELGDRFYLCGFSLGGQIVWGSFKYISHRLAGAVLLSPLVNYWWNGLPADLAKEAFEKQLPEDQWAQRVTHYVPWLTYWWNTQKFFPGSTVVVVGRGAIDPEDHRILCADSFSEKQRVQAKLQIEYDSLHQDMIMGFGRWDFSPMDLGNPIPGKEGAVHVWQGDNDNLIPVTLQRYINKNIPWVKYHEVPGGGHIISDIYGVNEKILRSLFDQK